MKPDKMLLSVILNRTKGLGLRIIIEGKNGKKTVKYYPKVTRAYCFANDIYIEVRKDDTQ